MNPEELDKFLDLFGNVGMCSFSIIMFFVAVANFIIERSVIRIMEAVIFNILFFITLINVFNILLPSTFTDIFHDLSTGILTIVLVLCGGAWGILLVNKKWREVMLRQAILESQENDIEEEDKNGSDKSTI